MAGYQLMYVQGHVEVLDLSGNFLFSADTYEEALRDLEEAA